jgi:hypothetical protein
LDIKPADNTRFIEAARVWCEQGSPSRGALRQFDTKNWADTTAITLQMIGPNGEVLSAGSFHRTTPQGEAIVATMKLFGFPRLADSILRYARDKSKTGLYAGNNLPASKELV